MALDDALFLVQRGSTSYRSKGSDISDKMKSGDMVLVQRGTNHFKATYDGSGWDKIQDSDLLLAWDGSNNRRVTGENFKALFGRTCYLQELTQHDYNAESPALDEFYADSINSTLYFHPDSEFAKNLDVGHQFEVESKNNEERHLLTVEEIYFQDVSWLAPRWVITVDSSSFPFNTYGYSSYIFDSCPRRARRTWNWTGNSSNSDAYKMCNNSRTGTGVQYTPWNRTYLSNVTADGATDGWLTVYYDYRNKTKYNDREQWFKFGDAPAVEQLGDSSFSGSDCSFSLFNYQGTSIGQPFTQGGIKVTYHNYNPDYCRKETYVQNGGANCPPAGKIKIAWQDTQSRTVIRVPGADWADVLKDGGYIWLNGNPYKITNPVQNECGGDPDYTRIYIEGRVEGNTETAGTMWTVTNCPP